MDYPEQERAEQPYRWHRSSETSPSTPYNELFDHVVKPVCATLGVTAVRADDSYEPGLVIADVARQIDESKFVVAELTLQTPTSTTKSDMPMRGTSRRFSLRTGKIERLPFDVSPFRTPFYENSIDGKRRVEEGLRRHVRAILDPSGSNAV